MKNIIVMIFALFSMAGFAQNTNHLTVMSYNIRYNNPNDGINIWENRKEWLSKSIKFFGADIVGAQEVTFAQLKDLETLLPHYNYVGKGRLGGEKGEYTPIFYVKDRFELLENDTFWLSKTPEVVGSKGWDAALPRIVTWAKFRDKKEGGIFYFFNTHFDHRGTLAREKSAELIAAKITKIAGDEPVILTGDLNTLPDSKPHEILIDNEMEDTFLNANQTYTPGYTANGFDVKVEGNNTIDYVFYKGKEFLPLKYHVLDGQRGKRFVSDHFPVIVKFKWDKPL